MKFLWISFWYDSSNVNLKTENPYEDGRKWILRLGKNQEFKNNWSEFPINFIFDNENLW